MEKSLTNHPIAFNQDIPDDHVDPIRSNSCVAWANSFKANPSPNRSRQLASHASRRPPGQPPRLPEGQHPAKAIVPRKRAMRRDSSRTSRNARFAHQGDAARAFRLQCYRQATFTDKLAVLLILILLLNQKHNAIHFLPSRPNTRCVAPIWVHISAQLGHFGHSNPPRSVLKPISQHRR